MTVDRDDERQENVSEAATESENAEDVAEAIEDAEEAVEDAEEAVEEAEEAVAENAEDDSAWTPIHNELKRTNELLEQVATNLQQTTMQQTEADWNPEAEETNEARELIVQENEAENPESTDTDETEALDENPAGNPRTKRKSRKRRLRLGRKRSQ